jgi:hypothetical protein
MAIIPIVSDTAVIGSMLLSAKRVNVFDKKMINFLEEIAQSMGVAFLRMQLREDIDDRRKALSRANDILSIECDVAKNLADGSDNSLERVLTRAGKRLGVKWLSTVILGEHESITKWTSESDSSATSFIEDSAVEPMEIDKIKELAKNNIIFMGNKDERPQWLTKISANIDGSWIAIPISGDKAVSPVGVFMMVSKTGLEWSKDEGDAIVGLATLLCILAKLEKNRIDMSRKIEETIFDISNTVLLPLSPEVKC